jgi:SAM-dependent methyltransferase
MRDILRTTCPGVFHTLKLRVRTCAEQLHVYTPALSRILRESMFVATGRAFKEDYLDRWTGQRDTLTPPLRLLFDGTRSYAEYQRLGDGFRDFLVGLGLQPHHHVLEVGSGNGKNARALAPYLTTGRYEGFEIVPAGVAWCQRHITSRHPHVRFQHANVYNRTYHPTGRTPARLYRFPYADDTFEFVVLTSVFTHMLPADLENYIREIARVLKPGGTCLASLFLLTDTARQSMAAGRSGRAFPFAYDPYCRVADRDWPEDAVAYDEEFVRQLFARSGLAFDQPIVRGAWSSCNEPNGQDCVLAVKAAGGCGSEAIPQST